MHAVINHLPLQKTTDWAALSHMIDAFEARRPTHYPAFRGCIPIRAGEDAGILVVTSTPVKHSMTSLIM